MNLYPQINNDVTELESMTHILISKLKKFHNFNEKTGYPEGKQFGLNVDSTIQRTQMGKELSATYNFFLWAHDENDIPSEANSIFLNEISIMAKKINGKLVTNNRLAIKKKYTE